MSHLHSLNEQQYQAAIHTHGPLLVIAGAGTGKTKTIVHRIINLIAQGVDPRSILAITFTNKAATEMRERVHAELQEIDGLPLVSTFHSLGVRILREHAPLLGLNKYFTILDSQDTQALIKQAMNELDIDPKIWEPKTIGSIISKSKSDNVDVETFATGSNPQSSIVHSIWRRYEEIKRESKSLDFSDLLSKTYELLARNEEILKQYQERWKYVHVDEYQDTNTIQYKLIRLLVAKHNNICAVGDGDQNIYSWRGADMRNILNFEKDFPNATIVLLEKNYRSTSNILQVAHEVISKNTKRIEKKLVTDNEEGEKVSLYQAFSAHQEAEYVASEAQRYISEGVEPREIAVLFRTNFQSRILEEAFLRYSLPYQVVGVKFFARKEIKDVMSYLRSALNPDSLADIKRIINEPKRGLGKVAIAKIFAGQSGELSGKSKIAYQQFTEVLSKIYHYAQSNTPSDTIRFVIKESGLEKALQEGSADDRERLENMKELVTYANKYDDDEYALEKFLEEVALLSDQDNLGLNTKDGNTVKLMTIHASKGLEFEQVFVVGLEQGLFPSSRDEVKNKHEEEEERRLCYVAFTRAKKQLHLSYAQMRTIFGQQRINEPSEFIVDIPEHLLVDADGDSGIQTSYLEF